MREAIRLISWQSAVVAIRKSICRRGYYFFDCKNNTIFATVKKRLLTVVADKTRRVVRQALSPTFVVVLLISGLLWYAAKLSKEYETDIPLNIRIDGQKYRVTATVRGSGSAILAQRLSLKRRIGFSLDELSSRASRKTMGALTITPASLQRAINGKINGLEVLEVVDAPDFVPSRREEEKAAGAAGRAGVSGAAGGAGKKKKGASAK
jgi:hypothetical protein